MVRYAQHVTNKRRTPQRQKAHKDQVRNSAGGFSFKISDQAALERFLILGCEGGTYYASEKKLTRENAKVIERCLDNDGPGTVQTIVDVSKQGRAPKNDAAIFALAMACGHSDPVTRKAALKAIPEVCRTGRMLFQHVENARVFRGWGRGLRQAYCSWYLGRSAENAAYQVVKYQRRGGMSHRDLLRLAGGELANHELTEAQKAIFRWVVAGPNWDERKVTRKVTKNGHTSEVTKVYPGINLEAVPSLILAYEQMKKASSESEVIRLIRENRMTWEMVPTQWHKSPAVWEALLESMPMGAMVRKLGQLSSIGLLKPFSNASKVVVERLGNKQRLNKARMHPLSLLVALNTYKRGRGVKGNLTWDVSGPVLDALDEAFYLSFGTIRSTGKRRLIALDVSGSMSGPEINKMPGITPRVGSGAMAMVSLRTEPECHVVAFTSSGRSNYWDRSRKQDISGIKPLPLTKRMRLDTVIREISGLPFGGTDCALPMLYAKARKIPVDVFEIYTDNESWAGEIHPHQALQEYRNAMGIPAKAIAVAMTATAYSFADKNDSGMLDVVGFDTAVPNVMSDFITNGY